MEVHAQAVEDNRATSNHTTALHFNKLMKPILVSLMIFGLYFEKTDSHILFNKIFSLRSYSLLILIFEWLSSLMVLPIISTETFDLDIFFNWLFYFIWRMLCVFNVSIFFYVCEKKLEYIRQSWDNLLTAEQNLIFRNIRDKTNPRKQVIIWTVCGWSYLLLNFSSYGFMEFGIDNETTSIYGSQASAPFPFTTLTGIIGLLLSFIHMGIWVFPVIFEITVSLALSREFEVVSKCLKVQLQEDENEFPKHFECIRQFHVRLCSIVCKLDDMMSLWITNAYIMNMPKCCFLLFVILTTKMNTVQYIMHSAWLSISFIYVGGVTIAASCIQTKAHSPLEHMYAVNVNRATPAEIAQLNLFLSKLNGPAIGFTALGLVTMTKEFMLTIVGLFLTYFVLIVQFHM